VSDYIFEPLLRGLDETVCPELFQVRFILIINTVGLKSPALTGDFDFPELTHARLAGAIDDFSRRDDCANPPALAGGS
jgi:hypothetical protein